MIPLNVILTLELGERHVSVQLTHIVFDMARALGHRFALFIRRVVKA